MYKPELNRVYKSSSWGYIVIKEFSTEGPQDPSIAFEIPGSDEKFTYNGLHKVSNILDSIDLVQDLSKE
tara:strand:- start:3423 stop:3629 length:207 start_codon:yes stop_codon:yes gene_type:complete